MVTRRATMSYVPPGQGAQCSVFYVVQARGGTSHPYFNFLTKAPGDWISEALAPESEASTDSKAYSRTSSPPPALGLQTLLPLPPWSFTSPASLSSSLPLMVSSPPTSCQGQGRVDTGS